MKLKKGDKIKVQAGKDRDKEGKIERVYMNQGKVLVTGVNMYKKHVKKNEQMPKGGVVELPRSLDISKVLFVCPKCGKATKLGYTIEKGRKFRICKKCKSKV